MKRIALLVVCIAVLASGMAFAKGAGGLTGLGVYGSFGWGGGAIGGGPGVTLKFGSFPVIGVKWDFSQNGYLGASIDWHFVDAAGLADSLTYFLGVGGFMGIGNNYFIAGARLPIGLQLWVLKRIEFFISVIPYVGFRSSAEFGVGGEFGFRFHF
jgi:hypothetical protein